jgi:phage gpG-like protein
MRIETDVQIRMQEERLRKAVERARAGGLRAAAFLVSQAAKKKIIKSRTASAPGKPPHSRRGLMKFAIRYEVAKDNMSAVIGPIKSKAGTSGQAHEFGGSYRGAYFPARPFMGPALMETLPQLGPKFRGTVRE